MLNKALIGLNDRLLGVAQRLCSDNPQTRGFKVRCCRLSEALGDESKLECVVTRRLARATEPLHLSNEALRIPTKALLVHATSLSFE